MVSISDTTNRDAIASQIALSERLPIPGQARLPRRIAQCRDRETSDVTCEIADPDEPETHRRTEGREVSSKLDEIRSDAVALRIDAHEALTHGKPRVSVNHERAAVVAADVDLRHEDVGARIDPDGEVVVEAARRPTRPPDGERSRRKPSSRS